MIDTRARVRWTTFAMGDTKLAVLISGKTPAAYRLFLREHGVPYFEAGDARVNLSQALARMGAVFREECVVSSGGGVLNGALLQAGLVEEVDIQVLPVIVGGADAPSIFEGYDSGTTGRLRGLHVISTEKRSDGSAFTRYAVR